MTNPTLERAARALAAYRFIQAILNDGEGE